jgi:hypothetical protein
MGLDMYLYKKTYVKNWDHMEPERLHQITIKLGGKVRKDIKPGRIAYITEEVGYWRKANAIHAWFVKHVQDGKDDCGTYYVPEERLQELLAVVELVLKGSKLVKGPIRNGFQFKGGEMEPIMVEGGRVVDGSIAQELLPSQAGFFFGGTDYDEYYIADLRRTRKILKQCLKESGYYYYESSW